MRVKIAVAQIDCKLGDKDANLQRIENLSKIIARRKPDIVCFPELATTGYSLNERWRDFAETVPGPTTERLAKLARDFEFYLIFGMVEKDASSSRIFDSAVLVSPQERVMGVYRKVHLWAEERRYFTPGAGFPVFKTKMGTIGLGICYDTEFPEPARALAVQGAKIIFFPSAEMRPMENHIDTYLRSRSAENCVFVAFSNRVGKEGKTIFFGRSQIASPDCRVVALAKSDENYAVATIDLNFLEKERVMLPYIEHRVRKAYSVLH